MNWAWAQLFAAGLFEVLFTFFLKKSAGFTKHQFTVLFILSSACSFYMMGQAVKSIPLGTSYAVWTGLGAFGTAIVGILIFGESASAARLLFLTLLLISIIGLKKST
jgi:quaternary ammonium compound-resistance protein SugE